MIFSRRTGLKGTLTIPGDKSISHRSIMLGSLADGITEVHGFLNGADCISSMNCFREMGVTIDHNGDTVIIHGKGLHGLQAPKETLDVGNSGTTTRLMSGILAAQNFKSRVIGDASICRRPMKRIMTPLSMMGADIVSENRNDCAPLLITGKPLHGIHYDSPVASAQVKSCILLAGLYADGETSVTEPYVSRNHTELMFDAFGVDIKTSGTTATVKPADKLYGQKIMIPGDISSAAYFIAAACLVPNSEVLIRNVGMNETRDGILRVAKAMGADITVLNENRAAEPSADLLVRTSSLHGTIVEGDIIPTLIDEIPIIAVMAAAADGTTIIRDAAELKVKESDRIAAMTEGLQAMGCRITPTGDGMIIEGGAPLCGAAIRTFKDHRIAMSFAIAALIAEGETVLDDAACVDISYPAFFENLNQLRQ